MWGEQRRHSSCPFPAGESKTTEEMLRLAGFCCLCAQEPRKPQQARNSICNLDRRVNISPLVENDI